MALALCALRKEARVPENIDGIYATRRRVDLPLSAEEFQAIRRIINATKDVVPHNQSDAKWRRPLGSYTEKPSQVKRGKSWPANLRMLIPCPPQYRTFSLPDCSAQTVLTKIV